MEGTDVAIVGGGAAGLSALRELRRRNVACVLLEARDALGGRVRAFDAAPEHDAGAAWIHGTDGSLLAQEATDVVEVCATNPWCVPEAWEKVATVWRDGRKVEDLERGAREWRLFLRSLAGAARRAGAGDALGTHVRNLSPLATMHARLLELWMGASVSDLQLREFESDDGPFGDHPGPHALPRGGMTKALAGLLTQECRLGARVTSVKVDNDSVVVSCGDRQVHARAALVTLPLGVLQDDHHSLFDPPLPDDKRDAIRRLGVGSYSKLLLFWDEVWWPSAKPFLVCLGPFTLVFIDHSVLSSQPLLEATAAGDLAREWDALSESDCVKRVVACLEVALKVAVPPPVKTLVTNWTNDEFARGAYSYWRVGALDTDVDALARPIPPLFFAGEATSLDYQGSLAGALDSGVKAANDIASFLSS